MQHLEAELCSVEKIQLLMEVSSKQRLYHFVGNAPEI